MPDAENQVDLTLHIPVYNAEPYLERVIAAQAPLLDHNVEIIFVDDGSTDKSVEMIEAYAKANPCVRLMKNDGNQGVGVSSNRAIAAAKGKYLLRCDADDEVIAAGVLSALEIALATDAPIVMGPYESISHDGKDRSVGAIREPKSGQSWLSRFCEFDSFNANLCSMLMKKSFILEHHVRFSEDREVMAEDTLVMLDLFAGLKLDDLLVSKDPFFRYHRRYGSASSLGKASRATSRNFAHRLLVQHTEIEIRIQRYMSSGLLSIEEGKRGILRRSESLLRGFRRGKQHDLVVAHYHRTRARWGSTPAMRKTFRKSLLFGFWRMLLP